MGTHRTDAGYMGMAGRMWGPGDSWMDVETGRTDVGYPGMAGQTQGPAGQTWGGSVERLVLVGWTLGASGHCYKDTRGLRVPKRGLNAEASIQDPLPERGAKGHVGFGGLIQQEERVGDVSWVEALLCQPHLLLLEGLRHRQALLGGQWGRMGTPPPVTPCTPPAPPRYLQPEEAGPGVGRQELLHMPVQTRTIQLAARAQHQCRHPSTTLMACG